MRRAPIILLAALACAEPTTPAPADYTLVDIHAVADFGDCVSEATGINAEGVVVGQLTCGFGPTQNVGFIFRDALLGLVDGGGIETRPLDINAAGQILVAADLSAVGNARATYLTTVSAPDAKTILPFTAAGFNGNGDLVGMDSTQNIAGRVGGTLLSLTALGGRVSGGLAINDAGTMVGWSETAQLGTVRATRWDGGVGTALPSFLTGVEIAAAINSGGVIVGWSAADGTLPPGDRTPHPVRWDAARVAALPTLGGGSGWAYDINDAGDIVGATLTADGRLHATLWRGGDVIDLGTLEGATESVALRIASDGSIAGMSGGRAVVWRRN